MTNIELRDNLNNMKHLDWFTTDWTPRLIKVQDEPVVYESPSVVLAMVDGSYKIGRFAVYVKKDGTSNKAGWTDDDEELIKADDIAAWACLPIYIMEDDGK